jgi:hypothetical protein
MIQISNARPANNAVSLLYFYDFCRAHSMVNILNPKASSIVPKMVLHGTLPAHTDPNSKTGQYRKPMH